VLDWDDLRYFLALARSGSLSAAGRALGVTQPTVGRRIEAFERRLGTKLFRRTPAGYVPSPAGESVLAHVDAMEREALAAERIATGRDAGLTGTVRVSAPDWLSARALAEVIVAFRRDHADLAIELVTESRWANLARRDADVAFRLAPFDQQEVVQRQIARVAFGLYASKAYLARRGEPDFARECEGHDVITMTDDLSALLDVPWLRSTARRARDAIRSNSREAQATAAAAGGGLVCLPRPLGDATTGLRLLSPPRPPPARPLWLGVHRDVHAIPRVRSFVRFATAALAAPLA